VDRNKELAEDLTSEIFMKALENFDSYDQERPFAVWIYRIAHNHLADFYKKVKAKTVPIEEAVNEIKSPVNFIREIDLNLDMGKVKTALTNLPQKQKEVIMMKYLDDLENTEIAAIMNTTEDNVRVMQHRALQGLKFQLSFLSA
jgi:RNA polymerase sigma-70 factor (ECF subfamily)